MTKFGMLEIKFHWIKVQIEIIHPCIPIQNDYKRGVSEIEATHRDHTLLSILLLRADSSHKTNR
jgi:hypothetical protein